MPRQHSAKGVVGSRAHAIGLTLRYWLARAIATLVARAYVRIRVEGVDRLPAGSYVLCANHQNWAEPFVLMACLPWRPRLYFFGPKEEDMAAGARNRLMLWAGNAVPYRPGKNDLLDATRRVRTVFEARGALAIFGEGMIHDGEAELLPIQEGAAYFAIRSGVPVVPVAINGTSWLAFGRVVRVRIGDPITSEGRPAREAVEALTTRIWTDLHALVQGYPDPPEPGPLGRWITELFNEWPAGSRPSRGGRAAGGSSASEAS